jgi:quercetin dioxygenase-like cupin family protein
MKPLNILATTFAALALTTAAAAFAHDTDDKVTKNFEQVIPNIPGKTLTALVVDYEPDQASRPHIHSETGFIYAYVIAGEIESKVNDEPARIYKAGESWAEPPGATHSISRNVSKTKPAKLLAVFVADTGDKELTRYLK